MFALFKLSGLALVAVLVSVSGILWGVGWTIWYFLLGGRVLEEHETKRREEDVDQTLADMRGLSRHRRSPRSFWARLAKLVQVGLPIVALIIGVIWSQRAEFAL